MLSNVFLVLEPSIGTSTVPNKTFCLFIFPSQIIAVVACLGLSANHRIFIIQRTISIKRYRFHGGTYILTTPLLLRRRKRKGNVVDLKLHLIFRDQASNSIFQFQCYTLQLLFDNTIDYG